MCPCSKQQTAKDQMTLVWFTACSLNRKPLSFTLRSKAAANLNYLVILRVEQLKGLCWYFTNFGQFQGCMLRYQIKEVCINAVLM